MSDSYQARRADQLTQDGLRLAQKRLSSLLRALPVGIAIVDRDGRVEAVNPSIVSLFQYDENELLGRDLDLLLRDVPWAEGKSSFRDWALVHGETTVELEGCTKEAEIIPIDLMVRQFDSGSSERYIAILVDVTERFLADRLKQEFLSMVSHDIRIPLSSIQTFLDLLNNSDDYGTLTELGRSRLELARCNIDRIMNLVGEILDLDQLQSGLVRLRLQKTSAKQLVAESTASVELLAMNKQIRIESLCEEVEVYCDAPRITQAIINLLANAVEHSPPQKPIMITAKVENQLLALSVRDQGPGIPQSERLAVFEKFRQLEGHGRSKGFGLGLAICKQIITLHAGTIECDNCTEGGTVFRFTIPLMARADSQCSEA